MDEGRFDNLTRVVGSKPTRRRAITMLGGGGLAALLARLDIGEAAACRKAKKSCKRDKQCCSGRCKRGRCKRNGEPVADFCLRNELGTPCGNGCNCFRSVSGAPFCGDPGATIDCVADAECDGVTGPGSVCFFNKDGDGECAAPCPNPI
jgi:hypothetical protein